MLKQNEMDDPFRNIHEYERGFLVNIGRSANGVKFYVEPKMFTFKRCGGFDEAYLSALFHRDEIESKYPAWRWNGNKNKKIRKLVTR